MFKEVFENFEPKDAHKKRICSRYSLDGGKLWMEGKLSHCAYQTPCPPEC